MMSEPRFGRSRKASDIRREAEKFLSDSEDIRLASRLLCAKNAMLIAESEKIWALLIQNRMKMLSRDSACPRIKYIKNPASSQRRVVPFPGPKSCRRERKPRQVLHRVAGVAHRPEVDSHV